MATGRDENNAQDLGIQLKKLSLKEKRGAVPLNPQIFNKMQMTMLHDPDCQGKERYPAVTYGMFKLQDGTTSTFFTSEQNLHVEKQIAMELESILENLQGPQTVTIYLNWSPCRGCTEVLLDLCKRSEHAAFPLTLVIKCVALYKIRWPKCNDPPCSHLSFAQHDDACEEGILMLLNAGVAVEAFDSNAWIVVGEALGVSDSDCPQLRGREETDEMVRESLKVLNCKAQRQQQEQQNDDDDDESEDDDDNDHEEEKEQEEREEEEHGNKGREITKKVK